MVREKGFNIDAVAPPEVCGGGRFCFEVWWLSFCKMWVVFYTDEEILPFFEINDEWRNMV